MIYSTLIQGLVCLRFPQCLGGRALAAICRMQAEDFAGTGSGVPDLLCWNTTTQTAKFIEVKGPGDNLSEKQRVC
jgi:Fanconi-associated nuclease 1